MKINVCIFLLGLAYLNGALGFVNPSKIQPKQDPSTAIQQQLANLQSGIQSATNQIQQAKPFMVVLPMMCQATLYDCVQNSIVFLQQLPQQLTQQQNAFSSAILSLQNQLLNQISWIQNSITSNSQLSPTQATQFTNQLNQAKQQVALLIKQINSQLQLVQQQVQAFITQIQPLASQTGQTQQLTQAAQQFTQAIQKLTQGS